MTPFRILAIAVALAAGLGLFILPQYLLAETAPAPAARVTTPVVRMAANDAAPQAAATAPDRAAVETIVRDYLLANPELLREMADRLKLKDEARAEASRSEVFKTAAAEIYDSEHQVVVGNPKGDVTVVEFFDYNCGYCKQALKDTEALLKADPNVRIVFKEFPVLSQDSVDAARVAVAVAAQAPDKYLDFHRQLLAARKADGAGAIEIARGLGLDVERLSRDLTDPKTEETLQAVHELAQRLGINGTPTYVVGEYVLPGAVGVDTLKEAVGNMRKCGKAVCS